MTKEDKILGRIAEFARFLKTHEAMPKQGSSTKEEASLYSWSKHLVKTRTKALAGTLVPGNGGYVDQMEYM